MAEIKEFFLHPKIRKNIATYSCFNNMNSRVYLLNLNLSSFETPIPLSYFNNSAIIIIN